jgi:hypothetical protein
MDEHLAGPATDEGVDHIGVGDVESSLRFLKKC